MNKLVDFLRTYGPVASSDSLCVENLWQTQAQFDVAPIETPAPRTADIVEALLGERPTNVVLTGTAGDGKTYHIRAFLQAQLPDAAQSWPGDEDILSFALPNGRELRVIRDLSEISDTEKAQELAAFSAALIGEDDTRLYLVAANDGQLLKYFRDAGHVEGVAGSRARDLHRRLSEMLREEREACPELSLRLFNLSRTWSEEVVDRIFDAVLDHPEWQASCEGCPGVDSASPCPIRLNRELLRGNQDAPSPFRARLKSALRLAAANDQHIPIRQLLTLVVNILLGDAKRPDQPLLDCKRAQERARLGHYRDVNPYDNAMGINLRPERRQANRVFSVLEMLSVGFETNNLIDAALVQGRPQDVHDQLFADEPTYGRQLFEPIRAAYVATAGPGGAESASRAFRQALAAQRRRAFFRLPAQNSREMAQPWRLTVFHYGDEYLRLLDDLAGGGSRELLDRRTRDLIRGLNRAFTGMMTNDEDQLWLAGAIGKTDDPSGRVATQEPIARVNPTSVTTRLVWNPVARRPALRLTPPRAFGALQLAELDLRPLVFEYLMRVANGSLPASFSRQCHQEIRHFALKAQTAIQALYGEEDADNAVRILSLGGGGELHAARLEV